MGNSPARRIGVERSSAREAWRERDLALRRQDILASAAKVFAAQGFQGAQVAEIASAAGVSLNSLYGIFKGKEELYEAVIHAAAETVLGRVQAEVEALSEPGAKLLRVVDVLFACFEQHGDLLQIYARTTHGLPWRVLQSMGEESHQVLRGFTQWLLNLAEDAKRAGRLGDLDAATFALSLIGAVTTTATRWVESPGESSLAEAAPRVRALFAALLREPPV